jgi:hypothetical protein
MSEYRQLLGQFPDADAQLQQLFKVVCDIEDVAAYTPASVGKSEQWSSIVNIADENSQNFCKALNGKTLFSALYGTYTVALQKLKALLKASSPADKSETPNCAASQEDGFKEIRRRKRHSTNKTALTSKKAVCAAKVTPPKEVATCNFFAPLRTTLKDTDADAEATTHEAVSGKAGRPPPIILTAKINLIQLQ